MSKLVATSKGKLRNNQQVDAEIYPEVHFPMEANLRWSGAVFTKVKHRIDRKSTRLNSSHITRSRMPSSA